MKVIIEFLPQANLKKKITR